MVIFGANMLLRLMERVPVIITIGAALLGYVAGEMAVTDPAVSAWIDMNFMRSKISCRSPTRR